MRKIILFLLFILPILPKANAQSVKHSVNVYFDFDSYQLKPAARHTLDSIAALFKDNEQLYIYGFTDDTGTNTYNDSLAIKRAKAVAAYLSKFPNKSSEIAKGSKEPGWNKLTDGQKRRVTVCFGQPLYANVQPAKPQPVEKLRTPDGIIFLPCGGPNDDYDWGKEVSITSYLTSGRMISGEIYAVDDDENILETGGMLEICLSGKAIQKLNGEPYTIKIPVNGIPAENMNVWVTTTNKDKKIRWKATDLPISTDGKYYILTLPPTPGCTKINVDRPTYNPDIPSTFYNNKVVYIATSEKYNFVGVTLRGMGKYFPFSAKVNDTLWAFTAPCDTPTERLTFIGDYPLEEGKKYSKKISIPLKRCLYSEYINESDLYYVCPDCLEKKKAKKGFWQWIKNLFN